MIIDFHIHIPEKWVKEILLLAWLQRGFSNLWMRIT